MIHLRKLEPDDLPFLYRWENDALCWSDAANHNLLSQHDLREYIAQSTGDIYRDGQLRLIVEEYEESASHKLTLGCIDLFDFDPRNRRAAIGMYIAPDFRGRGIGQEAVRMLEEYAFGYLHLRVLYAIIRVTNHACSHIYRLRQVIPTSELRAWTLEDNAILWQKINEN